MRAKTIYHRTYRDENGNICILCTGKIKRWNMQVESEHHKMNCLNCHSCGRAAKKELEDEMLKEEHK